MSNIAINRINTVMTSAEVANVKLSIQEANVNMSFLIGLTPEERMSIPKINVVNKAFTEDALAILANNADMFPAYVNAPQFQNDLTLFRQQDELATISRQLTEKLEDTLMLAGSEAYISGLTIYRMLGAAADCGIPDAKVLYDQLKARFSNEAGILLSANPNK